jgi:hypothetical protein
MVRKIYKLALQHIFGKYKVVSNDEIHTSSKDVMMYSNLKN